MNPTPTTPPPPRRSGISSRAILRPIGTMMLTSVVVVLGTFFAMGLPLDLLPSIVYPQVRVNVNNPGVEPEVMEETVAKPLETALATTEGLSRIEAEIEEGRVSMVLHFNYGMNMDFALQDAAKNLERARARLPDEADPPTIFKADPSQIPIYNVAFSSSTLSLIDIRDWVDNRLRPQLLTIDGVASIDVSGGLIREIQVVPDQERLRFYGLTVSEVIEALRLSNQNVAAGRISSGTTEMVGKTAGRFRSVDEIRDVVLNLPGGGRVPLSEVAQVVDTHQEQRLWARLDGVPAVRLQVRKQPEANTVAVADAVGARLEELRSTGFIGPEVNFETVQNQATFIRGSVNSVRNAALMGAILAMMVVMVFLGSLRKTFIIGLAIPVAILFTFLMMGLGNLTLNIMSLGGLALGVGLLIDNSIVMLENIFRHKDEGAPSVEEAAHTGAGEVQGAVIASTATNLAAVVPFLLISGLTAMIFRELILTISFAIIASLSVGLTVVPALSAQLGKVRFASHIHTWLPFRLFNRFIGLLRRIYRTVAERLIPFRWLVLGGGVAALVGVGFLTRDLGSVFLPQVDDGNVGINIQLPPGSSVEETNRVAHIVEDLVWEMPYVEHVFTVAGGQIFGGATAARSGRGSMDVVLASSGDRTISAQAWVQEMQTRIRQEGIPGAQIFVRPPSIRGLRTSASGSAVALTVVGDDLRELRRIGDEIALLVRDVPGLRNLEPSSEEGSPELAIELDRERAAYLGLNVAQVGQTLRTALDGTVATRFTDGNREFDIRVRLPQGEFQTPEAVGSVALFPGGGRGGGTPVYLRDVADVYTTLGTTSILRENQNRVLRLTGDVLAEESTVGEVNQEIRNRLASFQMPQGYYVLYGGEEEAIRENNRQLAMVIFLAIFLVFVVMAVQYESMVNPLVILMAIPMSLVGVGLALWVTGTPMSAPVLLGVILLAGIVVNNGILLVEYVEQFRREGHTKEEAVVEAGAVRLRPILMTSLTTALGMLPLAIGMGSGSELMQPLAISVVGGLTVSTFLTLFIVPNAYLVVHGVMDRVKSFLLEPSSREGVAAGMDQPIPAE